MKIRIFGDQHIKINRKSKIELIEERAIQEYWIKKHQPPKTGIKSIKFIYKNNRKFYPQKNKIFSMTGGTMQNFSFHQYKHVTRHIHFFGHVFMTIKYVTKEKSKKGHKVKWRKKANT